MWPTSQFTITLRSDDVLKNILKHMKTTKEFARYVQNNYTIIITPDKMIIKVTHSSVLITYYSVIPKQACLDYYSKELVAFEIDIDVTNNVLAQLEPDDTLTISSHDAKNILIILNRCKQEQKFYIKLKKPEESPSQIEKFLGNINKIAKKGMFFLTIHTKEFETENQRWPCNLCHKKTIDLIYIDSFQRYACEACFNKYNGDGVRSCLCCGNPNPTDDALMFKQWFKLCLKCWAREKGYDPKAVNVDEDVQMLRFDGLYTSIPPLDTSRIVENPETYEEFEDQTPIQPFSFFRFYPLKIVGMGEIEGKYGLFSRNDKRGIISILREEVLQKMGPPPKEKDTRSTFFNSDKLTERGSPMVRWGKYDIQDNNKISMTFSTDFPPAGQKSVRTYYVKGWVKYDSLDITITEDDKWFLTDNLYEFVAFRFN